MPDIIFLTEILFERRSNITWSTDKENSFFVVIVQIYFLLIILTKTPNLIGGQVVQLLFDNVQSEGV